MSTVVVSRGRSWYGSHVSREPHRENAAQVEQGRQHERTRGRWGGQAAAAVGSEACWQWRAAAASASGSSSSSRCRTCFGPRWASYRERGGCGAH